MIIVTSKGCKNQHFMKNYFHSEMHEKLQIANSKESENITFFFVFQLTVHTYYQYQNSDFKGKQTTHTIAFDALSYAFRVTDRIR